MTGLRRGLHTLIVEIHGSKTVNIFLSVVSYLPEVQISICIICKKSNIRCLKNGYLVMLVCLVMETNDRENSDTNHATAIPHTQIIPPLKQPYIFLVYILSGMLTTLQCLLSSKCQLK